MHQVSLNFILIKKQIILVIILGLHLRIECGGSKKTIQYSVNPVYPNKAAIELKKIVRENSYHFTQPKQGPINSNPHLSQKKKTGTKEKKNSTPEGRGVM